MQGQRSHGPNPPTAPLDRGQASGRRWRWLRRAAAVASDGDPPAARKFLRCKQESGRQGAGNGAAVADEGIIRGAAQCGEQCECRTCKGKRAAKYRGELLPGNEVALAGRGVKNNGEGKFERGAGVVVDDEQRRKLRDAEHAQAVRDALRECVSGLGVTKNDAAPRPPRRSLKP